MLIKIWYRYRYELAKKLACMGGGAMVMLVSPELLSLKVEFLYLKPEECDNSLRGWRDYDKLVRYSPQLPGPS